MKTLKSVPEILQKAYSLSHAQGTGILHYSPGELSIEQAAKVCSSVYTSRPEGGYYHFDYVGGRALKLGVCVSLNGEVDVLIDTGWFDHSDEKLAQLVSFLKC